MSTTRFLATLVFVLYTIPTVVIVIPATLHDTSAWIGVVWGGVATLYAIGLWRMKPKT